MQLLFSLLVAGATIVSPQVRPSCPPCLHADSMVARGDTADAIRLLRATSAMDVYAEEPGIWGRLGLLLTRTSPYGEGGEDRRDEAEDVLNRARDLLEINPETDSITAYTIQRDRLLPRRLLARGLLNWKRQDRIRAVANLDYALKLLDEGVAELSPDERLALHIARASIAEYRLLRAVNLVPASATALIATRDQTCESDQAPDSLIPAADAILVVDCWLEIRRYDDGPLAAAPLAHPEGIRRSRLLMRRHFAEAVRLDPGRARAIRSLLADFARLRQWSAYMDLARTYARNTNGTGWSLAFLAAGEWRLGHAQAADSLFNAALRVLPPEEQAVLRNVSESVNPDAEEQFFTGDARSREIWSRFMLYVSDPLFLTPINERRLEHFTRTVMAELLFGAPLNSVRGSSTDRGKLFIRYGRPLLIRQTPERKPWKTVIASAEHSAWKDFEGEFPKLAVVPFQADIPVIPASLGRVIFWSYGQGRLKFLFDREPGTRTARMVPEAERYAEQFRSTEPSSYDFLTADVPHQVVRFLGEQAAVGVDIYSELPADSLADPTTPGRAGLFMLPRFPGEPVTPLERTVRLDDQSELLTYRIELDPDDYVYSIEAVTIDQRIRAASRRLIRIRPFGPGLDLSDLLLARSVTPREEEPRDRHDFWMIPAADLSFAPGASVHLYFEVYGLAKDAKNMASYRVELTVLNAEDEGVLGRIANAVVDLLGGDAKTDGHVRWERTIQSPGVCLPEWFRIDLGAAEPGRYRVRVTLTDLRTEEVVTREREFSIEDERR